MANDYVEEKTRYDCWWWWCNGDYIDTVETGTISILMVCSADLGCGISSLAMSCVIYKTSLDHLFGSLFCSALNLRFRSRFGKPSRGMDTPTIIWEHVVTLQFRCSWPHVIFHFVCTSINTTIVSVNGWTTFLEQPFFRASCSFN